MPMLASRDAWYAPVGMSPVRYAIQLSLPCIQPRLAKGYRSVPAHSVSLRLTCVATPEIVRSACVLLPPKPNDIEMKGCPPKSLCEGAYPGSMLSDGERSLAPSVIARPIGSC